MKFLPTVFLLLFTAIGILGAVAVAIDWLQGVETYSWEAASCTIDSSEVAQPSGSSNYAFQVSYRYHNRGEEHRGNEFRHGYAGSEDIAEAERLAARYIVGSEVPCWMDPDDPNYSYLRRANLWSGLWIFVPLVFVAVGGGSLTLYHRLNAKPEHAGAVTTPRPLALSASDKSSAFKKVGLGVGFFAIFFLFGTGFLVPFFVMPALRVVEATSWQPVSCVILSSEVRSHRGDDSTTYSIETLYRYEVGGQKHQSNRYQFMGGSTSGYESKAEAVKKIPAGSETTCYVDPDDPFEAVIDRGFTTDYLFGLIPLLFVVIGLGGMGVVVGARAIRKDIARPSWGNAARRIHPAASLAGHDAAGPITLEPATGRVGKLGCAVGLALTWNAILAPFVWIVMKGYRSGNPEWFVTIVIIPFVLIGLMLLLGIPYSILGLVNPKPRVRISSSALRAGESVQIDWSFNGMASRIRRVKIWLESTKTAAETVRTNRSTSIRTTSEPMGTIDILERGSERSVEMGSVSFTLADDMLPSSEGEGAIGWKLKFQGDIAFWPDVLEEYPISVLTAGKKR